MKDNLIEIVPIPCAARLHLSENTQAHGIEVSGASQSAW
jgi:hypothetical protein